MQIAQYFKSIQQWCNVAYEGLDVFYNYIIRVQIF
jgi:hypothetical protein